MFKRDQQPLWREQDKEDVVGDMAEDALLEEGAPWWAAYNPEGLQPMGKPHQGMDIPKVLWLWVTLVGAGTPLGDCWELKTSKKKGVAERNH